MERRYMLLLVSFRKKKFCIRGGSFHEKCTIGTGSFWDIFQKEPVPIQNYALMLFPCSNIFLKVTSFSGIIVPLLTNVPKHS